ncbi:MAG: hypothetical protein AAF701_09470 [Pseudomonadota bacterium]
MHIRPHKSRRRSETIALLKDAIGAFALMTMLYVGLFIPSF